MARGQVKAGGARACVGSLGRVQRRAIFPPPPPPPPAPVRSGQVRSLCVRWPPPSGSNTLLGLAAVAWGAFRRTSRKFASADGVVVGAERASEQEAPLNGYTRPPRHSSKAQKFAPPRAAARRRCARRAAEARRSSPRFAPLRLGSAGPFVCFHAATNQSRRCLCLCSCCEPSRRAAISPWRGIVAGANYLGPACALSICSSGVVAALEPLAAPSAD